MAKAYKVEWEDITSQGRRGWVDRDDFKQETPIVCTTVGFIHGRGKYLRMAASFYGRHGIGDWILIPKSCVRKITELREVP